MKAPIRVGVLSFAHYHANFWTEVFRESDLATLVGIWDDDPARGAAQAAAHGTGYTADLSSLLANCDAVAICSETARHEELITQAARAGCAVLCEKPLATSMDACDRIAQALSLSGTPFMQSFPKRFDPVNHVLKDMLQAGSFGRVGLVRVRHGHYYGVDPSFAGSWHANPLTSGGGALLDEGVHGADFLRWMFGEPRTVQAVRSSAMLGLDVEDLGIATYRYDDGMVAELTSSWSFVAAENSIEIYGDKGTALLGGVDLASKDFCASGWLRTYTGGERQWRLSEVVPRFKSGQFHQQNALAFLDALTQSTAPPITLEDGRRALAMILAAYASADAGCEMAIQY